MIEQAGKMELILKIDEKRKEMISAADSKSYTSSEVVRYSQELDELLNQFQQLERRENDEATPFSKLVTKVAGWGFIPQH